MEAHELCAIYIVRRRRTIAGSRQPRAQLRCTVAGGGVPDVRVATKSYVNTDRRNKENI